MTVTAACQAPAAARPADSSLGLRPMPSVDEDFEEFRILDAAAQLSGAE